MKSGSKWWVIFAAYVATIYSTLGAAPSILDSADDFIGGGMNMAIKVSGAVIFLTMLLYLIFIKKEKDPHRYLFYIFFIWIFIVLNRMTRNTLNKMHMLEYAAMGVIVYNALKARIDRFDRKLYIIAGVICLITGLFEELIQFFLPHRVFAWRDVFINSVSALTVLLGIRYIILKEK